MGFRKISESDPAKHRGGCRLVLLALPFIHSPLRFTLMRVHNRKNSKACVLTTLASYGLYNTATVKIHRVRYSAKPLDDARRLRSGAMTYASFLMSQVSKAVTDIFIQLFGTSRIGPLNQARSSALGFSMGGAPSRNARWHRDYELSIFPLALRRIIICSLPT